MQCFWKMWNSIKRVSIGLCGNKVEIRKCNEKVADNARDKEG